MMNPTCLSAFREPPAALRGAPFWAWNDRLEAARLVRQISVFRDMGMGGFFMHPRTGLDTEYLGDDFMACVAACAERTKELGLLAWLYDEDRWPSGYAGGLITRDPACRERCLLFTPRPYGATPPENTQPREWPLARNERGRLLARYHVALDATGCLADYRRLHDGDTAPVEGTVWYAYLEVQEPCAGWNHATLGDVLNPEVTRRFIAATHERYAARVGQHFGATVPGIFTDEPHFLHKPALKQAADRTDLQLPFTDDLAQSYQHAFGADLLESLPEVVWNLPGHAPSLTRYRFHTHLCDRLVNGFLKPIGDWCSAHGLAFTGHLVEESTLAAQTQYNGDIMRGYPHLQIPGIDVLHDGLELNTAKQCQSVVHQLGRTAMASELYGVSGWDFSFADFKAQGDWQAALGVTLRVHHLAWASMQGQAKRDYPGSICQHQPWWREFCLIEDHFARINVLMTRGRPLVNVGVIHPIESFWLCVGPEEQTRAERETRERHFRELTEWLLFGLVDFDFVNESLLPEQNDATAVAEPRLRVGNMAYGTVIVPGLRTIRASTLERLERFVAAGGRLIFLGELPSLVNAMPSDRAARLAAGCTCLPFAESAILGALTDSRGFTALDTAGQPPPSLLHQAREDGDTRCLFFCNTDRTREQAPVRLRFAGAWTLTRWDTLTGETAALPAQHTAGDTELDWLFPPHGHLLLTLIPANSATVPATPPAAPVVWTALPAAVPTRVPVTLSEPNVLPLDLARWRWNDEPWQPREETLRIEDALRRRLGLGLRRSHNAQPWCEPGPTPALGRVTLEFDVACELRIEAPRLALEQPERWRLSLNGQPLALPSTTDWWVDEAIRTFPLPPLNPGRHVLRLETAFDRRTALEWSYLLGDFGVGADGADLRLTPPVRELAWGDWTAQGLPFYTGNVTYHVPVALATAADVRLHVPVFANPVLRAVVDGRDAGAIAFAPYTCALGTLGAGAHTLALTAFGTRHNAFGPLHHPGPESRMPNPSLWHTTGDTWTLVRHPHAKGILQPPAMELARA